MRRLALLLSVLLALTCVSSWAPSSYIAAPQLLGKTRSRSQSFPFVSSTTRHAATQDQFEEGDFILEAPTFADVAGMQHEWMDKIKDMDAAEMTQKAINALVLILSFGFALHTVLNIDHEITRGWTQQEIAMRIPLDNWAGYESALAEKPIMTKTFINVVIYCLGDWLSQTLFQKKNVLDFDVMRTLRNGFIGLCFGPLVHQYYEWSDHILPVEGGILNRLQKIFMDQTLYLSVKCSIYIAAVGLLQGDNIQTVKETVKERIAPICFTAWKFWPLVHCITYSVIPAQHRMLWVNCVDLVWNAILATMSRKEEVEELIPMPILATSSDVDMVSVSNDLLQNEPFLTFDATSNATEAVLA